jgi:uncharacterized protein (UPF0276 family)
VAGAGAAAVIEPAVDRVGLGWRPELAASIVSHRDRIDLVEVIADDYAGAGRRPLRALRTLATQVPVILHGVSLGLASTIAVDPARLERIARVVDAVEPEVWSEHLAFVRAGGHEIGHLAAPPRTVATVEGAAHNVERARRLVGVAPLMENVATLIDPPGSELDEPAWIAGVIAASRTGLLLDLHNLHANATNFGFDARAALARLPLGAVRVVHLAGGRWIGRLLDDHLHDVPEPVFDLLGELAALVAQPLTAIIERDGNFPPFERLLAECARARRALAHGRARARPGSAA